MQAENSIPEFKPYTEYPIGGFFKIGKEVFKVVNAVDNGNSLCYECDLDTGRGSCTGYLCTLYERSDARDVSFILYDELEDGVCPH